MAKPRGRPAKEKEDNEDDISIDIESLYPSTTIDMVKIGKLYHRVSIRYNLETGEAIVHGVDLAKPLSQALAIYKIKEFFSRKVVLGKE